MAAITVAAAGAGMTLAAANAGGDTVTVDGGKYGGHLIDGSAVLVVTVGATPTIVSLDGVAQASLTSKTGVYPLNGGVYGAQTVAVTYSQATSVTVGAQVL